MRKFLNSKILKTITTYIFLKNLIFVIFCLFFVLKVEDFKFFQNFEKIFII